MAGELQLLSLTGLLLIAVGAVLVLLPLVAKYLPSLEALERLPPLLIFVYRTNGFVFVTSPILIIASLAFLLWRYLS